MITDELLTGGLAQQNQPFSFSELSNFLCHYSLFLPEAISPTKHAYSTH